MVASKPVITPSCKVVSLFLLLPFLNPISKTPALALPYSAGNAEVKKSELFNKLVFNALTAPAVPTTINTKYAKDVSSESNIIAALYDVISGEAVDARNWERFKYLFVKEALLIPTNKSATGVFGYRTMTPDDYITMFSSRVKTGFFENELKHEVNSYGTIAHVFSTYETRETKNGSITNRGINSIQLFYDQNRYYIVNVLWCAESMGFTLPSAHLK